MIVDSLQAVNGTDSEAFKTIKYKNLMFFYTSALSLHSFKLIWKHYVKETVQKSIDKQGALPRDYELRYNADHHQ